MQLEVTERATALEVKRTALTKNSHNSVKYSNSASESAERREVSFSTSAKNHRSGRYGVESNITAKHTVVHQ